MKKNLVGFKIRLSLKRIRDVEWSFIGLSLIDMTILMMIRQTQSSKSINRSAAV